LGRINARTRLSALHLEAAVDHSRIARKFMPSIVGKHTGMHNHC
jgi:hypothetical protein